MRIPIIIVSGYLGAGKTTFLRRIIDNLDRINRKIAIIMNEFGEIAIDAEVIKGKAVNMIELQGGCVCCSLTGEFEYAIKEIKEKVKPDYIIVETTGIAEPDALLVNLENIQEVILDNIITIVDADSMVRFPEIGYTGRIQIEMADFILINKIDLVSEDDLKIVESKVRSINDRAVLFKTKYCNGDLDYSMFFGYFIEKEVKKREFIVHDEIYDSIYIEFKGILDKEKFENFLLGLPKRVYRGKGFVIFQEGSYLFNYVAGRISYEKFDYSSNRILFVGEKIKEFEKEIENNLKECIINERRL
ncbi:MAG: GTP-binding protein [Thermoproteota archaeon]|jgi:G3E family GTPase|nr:GTP-binding protein [Thermoproteota archaeon]